MKPKEKRHKSVTETAKEAFGLGKKKDKEPSPGQVATQNRDIGADIISTLRSIDFASGRLKNVTEDGDPETLSMIRNRLVNLLKETPTIFDDMTEVGRILLYSAKAWKAAVEDGYPNKAFWARSALTVGVGYLWGNVPEDKEELRDAILKSRIAYMEDYKTMIQLNETVDHLDRSIGSIQREIDEKREEEKKFADELKKMSATDEGRSRFARLEVAVDDVDTLNSEDRELLEWINKNQVNSQSIVMKMRESASQKAKRVTCWQQTEAVSLRLKENPDAVVQNLTGEVAGIIKKLLNEQTARWAEAKVVNDMMAQSLAGMKAVENGADAQSVRADTVGYVKDMVLGSDADRRNKQLEADRKNEWLRQVENKAAREAEEKARNEELQKQYEKLAQTVDNTVENTDENKTEQVQYNTVG